MLSNQLRKSFLDFFEKNEHKILPSSPLIPHNDPTLMFINAGMVQFKNIFTGKEKAKYTKVVTAQKCVRAGGKHNDLDNVGFTARHHTFFEMLGNFSFGDYFKEEAIYLAWHYLTKILNIAKDKLYITVYHEDEEAEKIWQKITGFSSDKIIKITTSDNFWSMGETGPCGPCSEIFYDHGPQLQGGLPGTPEEDGDRYVEIWNLVFMQYEILKDGSRISLPKPCVDTGMGLERIAAVMQGVHDNYDIDIFKTLIAKAKEVIGNEETSSSYKIIADHIRSLAFLIADGVMPSNEGRGYVLRKILRRALGHISHHKPIIHSILPTLIKEMGEAYQELGKAESLITSTLKQEEEQYAITIKKGIDLFNKEIRSIGESKVVSGDTAFKLHDTYGIPIEIVISMAKRQNYQVDEKGYLQEMEKQKERARLAWAGSGEKADESIWFEIYQNSGATEFYGYNLDRLAEEDNVKPVILYIIKDNKRVDALKQGEEAVLILNETPFYAESGGQVGDVGKLIINGVNHEVRDTKLFAGKIYGHYIRSSGNLKIGDQVKCQVNLERRKRAAINHSATHILHYILRKKLGDSITQKGSLVTPERLRFDFSFSRSLTESERSEIEKSVMDIVSDNVQVSTTIDTLEEVKKDQGIMALFGEKYDDKVRVVSIGQSKELCGGTHVKRSGDIGAFKIIKEEAIASGIRRIEAYTGHELIKYFDNQIKNIRENLELAYKQNKEMKKEIENLNSKILISKVSAVNINEINFVYNIYMQDNFVKNLKNIADELKKIHSNSIIALLSINENKINVLIAVTKDLSRKYQANHLLKLCLEEINGRGGGNAEIAQAGGDKIDNAEKVIEILQNDIAKKN